MYIQHDNSQPMTNAILERHRETCQEHDTTLCFRELSVSSEDHSELSELPGILSQVILAMHHFHMIVTYKILNNSTVMILVDPYPFSSNM